MAIAYNTSGSNSTPAHPIAVTPGAAAHDVIISAVVTDNTGSPPTWTPPASFDQLFAQITTADNSIMEISRKKDASGSEGSLSTSNSDVLTAIAAMLCFSGVNNTTPENIASLIVNQNALQASPLVISSGSFTPTVNGCCIVAIFNTDTAGANDATTTFSTTAGTTGAWTKPVDINSGFFNLAMAYAIQTTAGAITVQGSSASSGTAGGALAVIVLQPAILSPTINTQPVSTTADIGGTANFSIAATTSGGVLHTQWKFNGTNDGTPDSLTYARTVASTDQRGAITCVVSDDNGSVTSAIATLTLNTSVVYLWDTTIQSGNDVWLRDPTAFSAGGSTTLSSDLNSAGSGVAALISGATTGSVGAAAGAGAFTVVGASLYSAVAASAGVAALSAQSGTLYAGVVGSIGVASLSVNGIAVFAAALASAGVGAFTATAGATIAAVHASAGVGAFTALASSPVASVLASAGLAVDSSVGAAIFGAVLNASGAGTVSIDGDFTLGGGGATIIAADLSSVGAGTFAVVGAAFNSGVVSSAGVGAHAATGATVLGAVANAAGVGALTATASTVLAGAVQSAGLGNMQGISGAIAGSSFASAGVGAFDAIGARLDLAIVVMQGAAVASFVGQDGAVIVPVFQDTSRRRYTFRATASRLGHAIDSVDEGRVGSGIASPATKRIGAAKI